MSDLKACPFCGRIPDIEDCGEHRWFIRCKCGIAQDKLFFQKCDAVRAWNKRKELRVKDTNVPITDTISRQAAIDAVHKSIFDFFDICDDDEESPMTHKDEVLLEINKAITTQIKDLPSAEPVRMKGKWVKENIVLTSNPPQYQWHCSECGKIMRGFSAEVLTDYCPSCVADMRGEEDEGNRR